MSLLLLIPLCGCAGPIFPGRPAGTSLSYCHADPSAVSVGVWSSPAKEVLSIEAYLTAFDARYARPPHVTEISFTRNRDGNEDWLARGVWLFGAENLHSVGGTLCLLEVTGGTDRYGKGWSGKAGGWRLGTAGPLLLYERIDRDLLDRDAVTVGAQDFGLFGIVHARLGMTAALEANDDVSVDADVHLSYAVRGWSYPSGPMHVLTASHDLDVTKVGWSMHVPVEQSFRARLGVGYEWRNEADGLTIDVDWRF